MVISISIVYYDSYVYIVENAQVYLVIQMVHERNDV